jgi:DNA primase
LVADAMPVADYVIASEMETLPENASLQERESVARRLLPLLSATENDLYRGDNLQKLAVRLRIAEQNLLMWAAEQRKIAQAKPPGRQQPAVVHLPEPPPFGDEPPPYFDDEPDFDHPLPDRTAQRAASNAREAALEAYCLRMLLSHPKLIYDVNRKLRELAGVNPMLADGALGDLSSSDFTRTSYRALMDQFGRAMAQDEQEPLDYLRTTLPAELREEVEILLDDEWKDWQERQKNAFLTDLIVVRKQAERFSGAVDITVELVEKALRLRRERLERERQEMVFLEMDGDAPYQTHVMLSILAKRLIDAELNRRSQLLRE